MPFAVVTGANRGIGYELCRQLAGQGWKVTGTARKECPELAEAGIRVENLEITDQSSINSLVSRLSEGPPIDLLINNAGILYRDNLENLNFDDISRQIEVNALGPLKLASAMLPLLADNAKIAMITSRMGSIGDNGSGAYYGYRMSKAALNAASVSLARDLKGRGIGVVVLHPGFVQTDMTDRRGDVTADISASRLIERIREFRHENSGIFLHANGEELPW